MALSLPPSSKRSSPLSSGEGDNAGKVCVICDCFGEFNLFVLDFKRSAAAASAQFIEAPSTIRFTDYKTNLVGVCFLDPFVYAIGYVSPEYEPGYLDLWMSEYDMRPHLDSKNPNPNTVVDLAPKWLPQALSTPDGRILVFSNVIIYYRRLRHADFEVFDPKVRKWQLLPELMPHLPYKSNGRIVATTFNDSSTFVVSLNSGLMFALDLASPHRWEQYDPKVYAEAGWKFYEDDIPSSYEFLVVKHFVLPPFTVKNLRTKDSYELYDYVPSDVGVDRLSDSHHKISLLEYDDDEFLTCTAGVGYTDEDRMLPVMVFHIFKHDFRVTTEPPTYIDSFKYILMIERFPFALIRSVSPIHKAFDSSQEYPE